MKTRRILSSCLALASLVGVSQAQTITEVFLPQFAANGTTNNNRVQSAARLTIGGLTANATYRYYVSGETNGPGITGGAGNYFGINNTAGANGYIVGYTSAKSVGGTLMGGDEFASANRYSEFTTDGAGNYTGWFSVLPTGNARFNAGNSVRLGLILNNGAGGTLGVSTNYGAQTMTMLGQGTGTGVNHGTYLVGDTFGSVPAETMVLIYDNVAGTGRPIWGSWVESDGITTTFGLYESNVTAGRWGAYVPNDLADGIRRVEYWDVGANTLLGAVTDSDGIWDTLAGAQFVNANGDTSFNGGITDLIGINAAIIPEPSTYALLTLGAAGLLLHRLRRRS